MSFDHCTSGHLHAGDPHGKVTEVSGWSTYVTGPESKVAILYVTDVFGYKFRNNQLVADGLASLASATVYIPDFLEGSYATPEQLATGTFDLNHFLSFNVKTKRFPQILKVAQDLKKKYAKVFAVGYCWGAWACAMLAAEQELLSGIAMYHPSLLELPKDLENLVVPTLIGVSVIDGQFPRESREIAENVFEEKTKKEKLPVKLIIYPGTAHGFAIRADPNDAISSLAAKQAMEEIAQFFKMFTE